LSAETIEQRHAESVARVLGQLTEGKFDAVMELFTEDAEVNLPFQDPSTGFWSHVSGKAGLREFFSSLPRLFAKHELLLDEVMHVTDSRRVIAKYHGDFTVRTSGKPYRNTYIAVFEFSGDKIRSWTEFHNPLVLANALSP
jgi:ketosteroid isomerase-like protein